MSVAVRLYEGGRVDEALKAFSSLVDRCSDSSSAVRLGDVLAVLITHHARSAHWKQVSIRCSVGVAVVLR